MFLFFFMNLMTLLNLIFIFDIVKKNPENIVSAGENITSTNLKFNFLQF